MRTRRSIDQRLPGRQADPDAVPGRPQPVVHRRGQAHRAPPFGPPADPLADLGQATGDDQDHAQGDEPGEELVVADEAPLRCGVEVLRDRPEDESGSDGAADGAEAADDGVGEVGDGQDRVEVVGRDDLLENPVERAGDGGDHPGQADREQLVAAGGVAEDGEGHLGVPQGVDARADPRLADEVADAGHEQGEPGDQVVEAGVAAHEVGAGERLLEAALGAEVALEERLLGQVGEGQGGDGEVHAPQPKGEEADQQRHRDRRQRHDHEDEHEGDVVVLQGVQHDDAHPHLGQRGQADLTDPGHHRGGEDAPGQRSARSRWRRPDRPTSRARGRVRNEAGEGQPCRRSARPPPGTPEGGGAAACP